MNIFEKLTCYGIKKFYNRDSVGDLIKRINFEGATKSKRYSSFNPVNSINMNESLASSLDILIKRSLDLYFNNEYAKKAVESLVIHIVGDGTNVNFREKENKNISKEVIEVNKRWEDYKEHCDFEDGLSFVEIQKIFIREIILFGWSLAQKKYVNTKNSGQLKKIHKLRPETLDYSYVDKAKNIFNGIETSKSGKPLALYLVKDSDAFSTERERISIDDFIYAFNRELTGQSIGLPWLSVVMLAIKNFSDYEDAQLEKQKVASCFTGFIKQTYDSSVKLGEEEKERETPILKHGMMTRLYPGEEITFPNQPTSDLYNEYTKRKLKSIGAGIGIPYATIANDFSDYNYSTMRGAWREYQMSLDSWRTSILIRQVCKPITNCFLESLKVQGYNVDSMEANFTKSKQDVTDFSKDVPAYVEAVRGGILSWSELQRSLGRNPEAVLQEITEDFKNFDKFGVVLDSDPRKNMGKGMEVKNNENA